MRWLLHIFNHNACVYQAATQWDLPPDRITIWVIDWWCNVCLFTWWIDTRFYYSDLTFETGGFELASIITLVLQANRLTKCASHPWKLVKVSVHNFQGINFTLKRIYTKLFYIGGNPLTRWLPTASILLVIGWIYLYQFKCNYLKNQKYFAAILWGFWNLNLILNSFKINEPYSLSISEISDSKRRGYLNA